MINRKNPLVNTNEVPNELGTVYETGKEDFMIAFAAVHWLEGPRTDSRFIQWTVVQENQSDGNELTLTYYPVHPCTAEDFARFYPTDIKSKKKVENYKALGIFMCLDWSYDDFDLYGNWRIDDSYTSLEPAMYPCAT